jgi:hypothetical protein
MQEYTADAVDARVYRPRRANHQAHMHRDEKLTICNLKTPSLLEANRPRGYIILQKDELDELNIDETAERI